MSTLYTGAIAVLAAAWTGRVSSGGLEERMAAALDDFLGFALGSRHLYRFLVSRRLGGGVAVP
ncbi:hypothetical protein ACFPOI_03295 [Nonomuraea angiospora]|uniref:Uncharacterized protein n=1 Tax=Nonomuraea angiospora TaxID=46172 RepID=A0ABR9MAU2_9ACTN|nr:hypothetical protein [Nonomuraea angiospora]MBE1590028.1 hypothetical protein [Nonomuraea angiospora]